MNWKRILLAPTHVQTNTISMGYLNARLREADFENKGHSR